jgi:hypothetical protein
MQLAHCNIIVMVILRFISLDTREGEVVRHTTRRRVEHDAGIMLTD